MERREGVELRADGRILIGAAIRYGDVSPTHRERFERGSLTLDPHLSLSLEHRTLRTLAYGRDVQFDDRPAGLFVRATLPRTPVADVALDGVRSGRFRGYSLEFIARRETRDTSDIRVIQRADVRGLALVDRPSYPGSTVEARKRRRRRPRIRSKFPTGIALDCRCGPAGCDTATIDLSGLKIPEDIPAFIGNFDQPLGRAVAKVEDGIVGVEAPIPDTTWGRDLLAAPTENLIVRPYPTADSVFEKRGTDRLFTKLAVAAWVYAWTDQTGGFGGSEVTEGREALELDAGGLHRPKGRGLVSLDGSDALGRLVRRHRGGIRLWL